MSYVTPRASPSYRGIPASEPEQAMQPAVREEADASPLQSGEASDLVPADRVEALFQGCADCSWEMRDALCRALGIQPGRPITRAQERALVDSLADLPVLHAARKAYEQFFGPP